MVKHRLSTHVEMVVEISKQISTENLQNCNFLYLDSSSWEVVEKGHFVTTILTHVLGQNCCTKIFFGARQVSDCIQQGLSKVFNRW